MVSFIVHKCWVFLFKKGVLFNIIHLTAVVNQTFPIYLYKGWLGLLHISQSKKTTKTYTQLLVLVCWLIVVNMARQADRLVKIGQEGFAAIDEHFGHQLWRFPMPIPHFTTFIRQTKFLQQNLSTATRRLNAIRGGFMSITLRGNQFRFKDLLINHLRFLYA